MIAMSKMKDREYDLAIVDPPYGIGNFVPQNISKVGKNFGTRVDWNEKIPNKEYFNEIYRVSQRQIIWGANYYNCFINGGALIWDKGDGNPKFSRCEIASLSFQKKVDYVHINWQSGFYRAKIECIIHECQKPIALYQWLIKNYAKQGDRILDTHLGSGSSAIAADIMGFDFTGYEIDKDYYEAALDRFNRHKQQGVMEF